MIAVSEAAPLRVDIGRLFLPKYRQCPKHFLQSILGGEKQVLEQRQVKLINTPRWPELSVKAIFPA